MSPRQRAGRGDQLLAAVRDVNRLTRERGRINRRLKVLKRELKDARAKVRAIMQQVQDVGPDVYPSKLTAGASGFPTGEALRRARDAAKTDSTTVDIGDLEPFEK